MSLHEELIRRWEKEELHHTGCVSPELLALRERRVAGYIRDIGVNPQDRHELRRRIELSEASGCRESLGEIIADIRTHVRNGSSVVLAAAASVPGVAPSPGDSRAVPADTTGP